MFKKKIDVDYNLVIIFVAGVLVGFILRSFVVKIKHKQKRVKELTVKTVGHARRTKKK